jgi:succinate dehydrogenase/fumarate reductase flavoprotein subunit
MLTRYVSQEADYALLRGVKIMAPGDGLLMGLQVGAATVAMQRVHGYVHMVPYPMPFPLRPFDSAIPLDGTGIAIPGISQVFPYGIVVNIRGERFADETKPRVGETMCNAILQSAPEGRAFIICDTPVYTKYFDAALKLATTQWQSLKYTAPFSASANTIEELAKKLPGERNILGVNPTALASTVSEYNKAVDAGTTALLQIPKANIDPLGLFKTLGPNYLEKIATPPFYAIMDGGLVVNAKCQVVDTENRPVSGLYSAGDAASLWHSNYASGYAQAHTMGYISGTTAAAYAKTV